MREMRIDDNKHVCPIMTRNCGEIVMCRDDCALLGFNIDYNGKKNTYCELGADA